MALFGGALGKCAGALMVMSPVVPAILTGAAAGAVSLLFAESGLFLWRYWRRRRTEPAPGAVQPVVAEEAEVAQQPRVTGDAKKERAGGP